MRQPVGTTALLPQMSAVPNRRWFRSRPRFRSLGLLREGFTEAASALKGRKLIDDTRGEIRMLSVRGLKAASCSCYQIVKTVFDRAQGQRMAVQTGGRPR